MNDAVEEIARICHEVNRGLCLATGDASQPSWADAPDWQKQSAVHGVEAIMKGEVRTPEDSHNNWCKEKVETGWTYGAVKDAVKKTHPCLVPYHELPVIQRLKDKLFTTIVQSLR
jgi:hypothetical protein